MNMVRQAEFGMIGAEAGGPTSNMTGEGFDPYRAWLNVRDVRRPLNAYQLLGLPALEADLERIRRAATQQRAAMELHRFEAHPATWRQISSELEQAIQTLTNPELKVAYDLTVQRGNAPGPMLRVAPVEASPGAGDSAATPAADPATALRCPQCGSSNPSTRKFCSSCGGNLWETCPNCGTLSLAGERYCGACGSHFASNIRKLVAQYEANLEKAESLREEARFEEALELLISMLAVEHSYLAEPMARAKRLMQQVGHDRELLQTQAEASHQQARELAEKFDFTAALTMLEQIPAQLRGPEIETLYTEVRAKSSELALLEETIDEALRHKRSAEVLDKVRRVLEIKPDHARATKLAHQFAQIATKAAAERLGRHRYEEAFRLLRRLPEAVHTGPAGELLDRATELTWMVQHVRSAPYADATLTAIAKRLHKLAPNDPQAARWHQEIQHRAAAGLKQARFSVPPLIRPPEKTYCGLPVDWLTGFRRIDDRPVRESACFRDHPGGYFVAAGLALHALGLSGVRVNLLPDDGGVWGRLSRVLPKRSAGAAWGLDLGCGALKAVRLVLDDKQKAPSVTACDYQEYRKVLSQAADDADAQTLIREALEAFIARNPLRGERVCLGLPGSMVLSRTLTMPVIPPDKLDVAVRYEARRQFSHLHGELVMGYHVLERIEGDLQGRRENEAILVVARRARLELLLKACQELGVHVESVQADFLALHNLFLVDHLPEAGPNVVLPSTVLPALAALDIGADVTNFIVSSPRVAWHRTISLGTERFTKTLVQEFGLSFSEAEQLLRNPVAAPSLYKFFHALEPVCEDFVEEIRRTLDAFSRIHHRQRAEMILGLGGGFQLHGLVKYLRYGPQEWDRCSNGDRAMAVSSPA